MNNFTIGLMILMAISISVASIIFYYINGGKVSKIGIMFSTIIALSVVLPVTWWFSSSADRDSVKIQHILDTECIKCKYIDNGGAYFAYTCDGTEYYITRQQYINLNVSNCEN